MHSENLNSIDKPHFENIIATTDQSTLKDPIQAIVYNKNLNQKIFIESNPTLYQHQVVCLHIGKQNQYAFIKEIQKHPVNEQLVHVDFFMPDSSYTTVDVKLPIRFTNQEDSIGIKRGGMLYIMSRTVPVRMNMKSIIPYLSVSVAGMNNKDVIHVSDIDEPEGIKFMRKDISIATLLSAKG